MLAILAATVAAGVSRYLLINRNCRPSGRGRNVECLNARANIHDGGGVFKMTVFASIDHLSQIIVQVTAPAFLLGAVSAFLAVVISRLNRVIDRTQVLNAIKPNEKSRLRLKADVPRLIRRASLLNTSILFAAFSAITTALLVIVAFISALVGIRHEYGVAVLFICALACFTVSLIELAREIRMALHEYDYFS
jgi:hypothetical protein